jgi:hypothetical protein
VRSVAFDDACNAVRAAVSSCAAGVTRILGPTERAGDLKEAADDVFNNIVGLRAAAAQSAAALPLARIATALAPLAPQG